MTRAQRTLLVFIALATGGFAIGTTEFGTMSLLPLIQDSFGITPAKAGHAVSAYAFGVVLGAPAITVLAARVARKPMLVALMAWFAVGNGLSALAPGYAWFITFRFLSGLPHGAYFGMASLMAASLAAPHRRTRAVGHVMLGLTLAMIVGVSTATWLGDMAGWRAGYWAVTVLASIACGLIILFAPYQKASAGAHPRRELGALARPGVWLTLSIGAIGFGGMFAVYTYLTSTLAEVTHMTSARIPLVLAVFGLGSTLGNMIVPRFADRSQMPTAGAILVWSLVALLLFPWAAQSAPWVAADIFCIGFGGALATILQTRLMDVAGDAQNLAAALNHVAFNFANALGPLLAGLALAAGWGLASTGIVGALLCVGGLVMWGAAWYYEHYGTLNKTSRSHE